MTWTCDIVHRGVRLRAVHRPTKTAAVTIVRSISRMGRDIRAEYETTVDSAVEAVRDTYYTSIPRSPY